jgi:DNA-3-methyladenine glycosylase I
MAVEQGRARCAWVGSDPLYRRYHDEEWGVPLHNDQKLFELLILEGFQAGLSWRTILHKREAFRRAFKGFDPARVAWFSERKLRELEKDPTIVRNRQKVRAAVRNAQAFIEVKQEFGSFDRYLWRFVGGQPIIGRWQSASEVPSTSPEAEALSRDLKQRGFKFVGPTTVYAFMQASGMVMDHAVDCFRFAQLADA